MPAQHACTCVMHQSLLWSAYQHAQSQDDYAKRAPTDILNLQHSRASATCSGLHLINSMFDQLNLGCASFAHHQTSRLSGDPGTDQ